MSTLEFKINSEIKIEWFEDLTRVWNEGLEILIWLQHYNRALMNNALDLPAVEIQIWKVGNDWVSACQIAQDFKINYKKPWSKENIVTRYCVPIVNKKFLTPPPIKCVSAIDLRKCFAKKRCDWLRDRSIPMVYVNDLIGISLIPAWEAYKKGKKGKPRFKSKKYNLVKTIKSEAFRAQCTILDDDFISLPGIKAVANGLNKRYSEKSKNMIEDMRINPSHYPRLIRKISTLINKELKKQSTENQKIGLDIDIEELRKNINHDEIFEKAIAYFSSPGSFNLIVRDKKTYLQIQAEMPCKVTKTNKLVGVDSGLDLLVHTTSGLKVKHKEYLKEYSRIDILRQKLSKKEYGSKNYVKLAEKIKAISNKISRGKRKYQSFYAQQIADVNDYIAYKKIEIAETLFNPEPLLDEGGNKYLPNGKSEAKLRNQEILSCAIAQFLVLLKEQCTKKHKYLNEVLIEAEATPQEVLECSSVANSVCAKSSTAQSLPSVNAWEGKEAILPNIAGKALPTGYDNYQSEANPPTVSSKNRRRSKRSF